MGRPSRSSMAPARARLAWLVLAAPLALSVAFIVRTPITFEGRTYFWLFDDGMISMRYARNLADGHGLVWNAGERVEGYSNFLWTLVMAAVHGVGFGDSDASVAMMAIGVGVLLATAFVAGRIAAILSPGATWVRVAAMLLAATFYPLVYWALHGLETGLAALIVALAVLLALQLDAAWSTPRGWALAAVAAAGVLTRDDLLLPLAFVVAYAIWRAPRRGRAAAILIGVLAATVAAHAAFRLAYYDDALPNTYYLKLTGIQLGTRLATGSSVI